MSQVHAHTEGATLHLSLAGTLTIAEAAETRASLMTQLSAAASEVQAIRLDLSAVPEIDSSGIQLLVSAARTLQSQGRQTVLHSCSAVVRTVSLALGAADTEHCCGFSLATPTGAGA
jgi:anti-anti-sigma factor